MAESAPPPGSTTAQVPALKKSAWNLLLLAPLVVLITPLYNRETPVVFGMPMYYWFQFAAVPFGVLCVGIVYVKTRHH